MTHGSLPLIFSYPPFPSSSLLQQGYLSWLKASVQLGTLIPLNNSASSCGGGEPMWALRFLQTKGKKPEVSTVPGCPSTHLAGPPVTQEFTVLSSLHTPLWQNDLRLFFFFFPAPRSFPEPSVTTKATRRLADKT